MRKNLCIIGARGFGRECVGNFRLWNGFSDQYIIKGFLDDKADALEGYGDYPPIIGTVETYKPQENDVFLCALGVVKWRKKYIDLVLGHGGCFETIISPKATIHQSAVLGKGDLILDNAIVSSDVKVGDYVLCHGNVVLGHDTIVESHVVCEAFTFTGGFAKICEGATLHTRATILPHKKVGVGATVGAGSTVISNVKEGKTVFGVPAIDISL